MERIRTWPRQHQDSDNGNRAEFHRSCGTSCGSKKLHSRGLQWHPPLHHISPSALSNNINIRPISAQPGQVLLLLDHLDTPASPTNFGTSETKSSSRSIVAPPQQVSSNTQTPRENAAMIVPRSAFLHGNIDVEGDLDTLFDARNKLRDKVPLRQTLRFLDKRYRLYSHALFKSPTDSLEDAAENKMEAIFSQLGLQKGMYILDIGGGWGGVAQYCASRGVRVTTITLAETGADYIRNLIIENDLLAEVRLDDFFDHDPAELYDHAVSLASIEHMPDYRRCARKAWDLLKPGGRLCLDGLAAVEKYDTATPDTRDQSVALSSLQDAVVGLSESSSKLDITTTIVHNGHDLDITTQGRDDISTTVTGNEADRPPPPLYPVSEAPSSSRPPPFSSLFAPLHDSVVGEPSEKLVETALTAEPCASGSVAAPAYSSSPQPEPNSSGAFDNPEGEAKSALLRDTKAESSRKDDDAEPPPAYEEGDSPLSTFTYVMSAAGGAASIITQVQQGGAPMNAIGDVAADETICMDVRGTRFVLSRDELLTLPEFVLLSLFPNGLFPEGHPNGFNEHEAVQVDYDPASLQYMLDFFREVAQSIPVDSSLSSTSSSQDDDDAMSVEPLVSRDDSSKRAGIIVLREDLDFYVIPPRADITQAGMMAIKRAAGQALQKQGGIFSGLKRSDEPGTTESHLIEMLTAGGFNHDDTWGHRAGEPNKAVICSLALARLRSDIKGNEMGTSAVGMAQKLLLFWRKPARRCWWEGIDLTDIEGVEGKLKVWIRRVWTLEMSVLGLR
ncbi:hypothetical protein E4U58_004595 [Claviceps cyperi]|nr:hypothetical protein E4U58_004595 [Claviceps cyperi]